PRIRYSLRAGDPDASAGADGRVTLVAGVDAGRPTNRPKRGFGRGRRRAHFVRLDGIVRVGKILAIYSAGRYISSRFGSVAGVTPDRDIGRWLCRSWWAPYPATHRHSVTAGPARHGAGHRDRFSRVTRRRGGTVLLRPRNSISSPGRARVSAAAYIGSP